MKFEHVWFNAEFWRGKKEADFIAHESHHGLGEKQLKEAFLLINPQTTVIEKPASTQYKKEVED
jgi:hypothetical protein